ncbi:MAG: hypothetical protein MJZ40_05060 [Bacteroidaceae bacterium]|nr:hypothetical protein [Bacteroidaceae bacterium]
MKQYIPPTLTLRPIYHEGMLCVSMRKRVMIELNDQYQHGSSEEDDFTLFGTAPTHSYDNPFASHEPFQ